MKTKAKKCEVTDTSKGDDWVCGNKAVAKIRDVACGKPYEEFYVCRKHKKQFLVGDDHYEEVKKA